MLDKISKLGSFLLECFNEGGEEFNFSKPQSFFEKHEVEPIHELLSYSSFDEENGVFDVGDSWGFFYQLPPLIGLGIEKQEYFSEAINKVLAFGDCVQVLLFADGRIDPILDQWVVDNPNPRTNLNHDLLKALESKRKKALQNQDTLDSPAPPRCFSLFFSYSSPKKSVSYTDFLEKKHSLREDLRLVFGESSLEFGHGNAQKLMTIVSAFINFESDTKVRERNYNPHQSLSSQMAVPGAIWQVHKKGVSSEGATDCIFRSYEATKFPPQFSIANTTDFLGGNEINGFDINHQINCPFYVHYGFRMANQKKELQWFKLCKQLTDYQYKFPFLQKLEKIRLSKEEHDFVDKRIKDKKPVAFVDARLSFGIFSPPSELNKNEQKLIKLLANLGIDGVSANDFWHLPELIGALPMSWSSEGNNLAKRGSLRKTLASEVCNFSPLIADSFGTCRKGTPLLSKRGQITRFSPFDAGCPNSLIFGTPGSGKSYFVLEMLSFLLRDGETRAFVVDLGKSFQNACQLFGGQSIVFSKKNSYRLNPFDIQAIANSGDEEEEIDSSTVKAMFSAMVELNTQNTSREDINLKNLLYQNVLELLKKQKKDGKINTIDTLVAHLKQKQRQGDPGERQFFNSLIWSLDRFGKNGEYAKFFNGKEKPNFQSDFLTIEMEELSQDESLKKIILQLLCTEITNQVLLGDRQTKFLLIIDEAWSLLKDQNMVAFLEGFARRVRKCNGALILITQCLGDMEEHSAKAILDCCDNIIFLGDQKGSLDSLKKLNIFTRGMEHIEVGRSSKDNDYRFSHVGILNKSKPLFLPCISVTDNFARYAYDTRPMVTSAIYFLRKHMTLLEAIEFLEKHSNWFEKLLRKADGSHNFLIKNLSHVLGKQSELQLLGAAR